MTSVASAMTGARSAGSACRTLTPTGTPRARASPRGSRRARPCSGWCSERRPAGSSGSRGPSPPPPPGSPGSPPPAAVRRARGTAAWAPGSGGADPEACALEVRHLLLDRVPGDLRADAAARSRLDVVGVVPGEVGVPPPLEHRQALERLEELLERRELDTEPADRRRERVQDFGAHVEPAVEQDELGDALGVERGEAHAEIGAERVPHEDGAVETEAVEQAEEVRRVVGEAVAGRGLVAVTPAAEVVGDEPVTPAERVGDRVPDRVVRREPVDPDD